MMRLCDQGHREINGEDDIMSVCGKYVNKFNDASHVVFRGNLDDPFFREIAIQEIISVDEKTIKVEKSGTLTVRKGKKECVALIYSGFFRKESTTGHPFKDEYTPKKGSDKEGD